MLRIKYNNDIVDGQFLTISQTKSRPIVEYIFNPKQLYTLIMYDPDTPFGDYIHWVIINIEGSIAKGETIVPYKGPAPPINTGIHRYIFLLFSQSDRINRVGLEKIERNTKLKVLLSKIIPTTLIPITKKYFTSRYQNGGRKSKRTYKNNKTKTIRQRQ